MEKTRLLSIEIPLYLWQNLVAMSEEDMRNTGDFILWLIHQASIERGLIYSNNQDQSLAGFPEREHEPSS
jgi:hypothetical protein